MEEIHKKWGLALCVALATVAASELFLRWKFLIAPVPSQEIQAVQAFLKPHPKLGFCWQENIPASQNIVLRWRDNVLDPLVTDDMGFKNHPEAIRRHRQGHPIDVIGIGDSFFQGAAFTFYEFFRAHDLFYYSMATHRYCPPQYNIVLVDYAMPAKPAWILYGIFENDFSETADFEKWRHSGLDWFTFHSGTWCGRPLERNFFRGWRELLRRLLPQKKFSQQNLSRVLAAIDKAYERAKAKNVHFLVLLIPSKETAMNNRPITGHPYDTCAVYLRSRGIPLLDIRSVFAKVNEPATLYYKLDGHWNRTGIKKAAEAIGEKIWQR